SPSGISSAATANARRSRPRRFRPTIPRTPNCNIAPPPLTATKNRLGVAAASEASNQAFGLNWPYPLSYETVRRWVNHFGPMIAANLRKRRLKPYTTLRLDEVYLKIDGRMVYLWRAVDAEGEVLDVLVQSKRNKHAALLSGWSLTTCDHIARRSGILGSNGDMSAGDGRATEPRIRISRRGGGNARCSGSRAPAPRRISSRAMLPSTTPSTPNAISLQRKRTACYALRRWTRGVQQPQLPNNCRGADASHSTRGDVTKPAREFRGRGPLFRRS